MIKLIVVLLVALVLEAVGVVLLSSGLKQLGGMPSIAPAELLRLAGRALSNGRILLGVLFEALFFLALLFLLARRDVSLIWPLTSLGFVITALMARWFNQENVSGLRWAGICLIVLGAGLVTYGEKQKETKPTPATQSGNPPLQQ